MSGCTALSATGRCTKALAHDGKCSFPPRVRYTPADVLAEFTERAGIMEYEGGLSREEADRLAWESIRKAHGVGLMAAARKLAQAPAVPQ